jgi:hypothetical protein
MAGAESFSRADDCLLRVNLPCLRGATNPKNLIKSDSAVRFGRQIPALTDLGQYDQHRRDGSRPADPRCDLRHQLHPVPAVMTAKSPVPPCPLWQAMTIAVSIGYIFNAMAFQGLFCAEARSHCRNAASLGESARASGETR